jgi:hypothetical protein
MSRYPLYRTSYGVSEPNTFLPLPGIKTQFEGHPASSLDTALTATYRLTLRVHKEIKVKESSFLKPK